MAEYKQTITLPHMQSWDVLVGRRFRRTLVSQASETPMGTALLKRPQSRNSVLEVSVHTTYQHSKNHNKSGGGSTLDQRDASGDR